MFGPVYSHYVDVNGVKTRGCVRLFDGQPFFISDAASAERTWDWTSAAPDADHPDS